MTLVGGLQETQVVVSWLQNMQARELLCLTELEESHLAFNENACIDTLNKVFATFTLRLG
jgi:hypothetical protein